MKPIALACTVTISMGMFGITHADDYVTVGQPDCTHWTSQPNAAQRPWFEGFVSGLGAMENYMYVAAFKQPAPDVLSKLNSGSQLVLWLTEYCKKNPLNSFGAAGFVFFRELHEK